MLDRSLTILVPPLPWLVRLRMPPHRVARSASSAQQDVRLGLPDFGGSRSQWPLVPRRPGLRAALRAAWRRHRTRQWLTELDAHLLKDIGITYADAENEANKPFWSA
jgi:uncharacterized protein YjiS (DUF1127 family)